MKLRNLVFAALAAPLMAGTAAAAGSPAQMASATQPQALHARAGAPADPPGVEECGYVTVSSPTKYICRGKVYTAYQLTRLREAAAKKNPPSAN